MADEDWLTVEFEEQRDHLRAVAYRMLGSRTEADDAVQEVWIRLSRVDPTGIESMGAWLTTVVARVCLGMLRTRTSRREHPLDLPDSEIPQLRAVSDPEQDALLADSVGLALLVVLDALTPAERIAFVLHDMFAVPFDEIASIVGRSPDAARQLASRGRRRVRGTAAVPPADLARQRGVVEAFLAASRRGDFDALLAVLDPEIVLHADGAASPTGTDIEISGARAVAQGALGFSRLAAFAEPALVDGVVGIVARRGDSLVVLVPTVIRQKITEISIIADPDRVRALDLAALDDRR